MASLPDADPTISPHQAAPRPPTPPRETRRDPVAPPKPVPGRSGQSDAAPSHLQTPPDAGTPTSSAAVDSSLKSHRKRVEWSAHTEYKEYTESLDVLSAERLDRSSPIAAPSPRPIKGILKASQSHRLDPHPLDPHHADGSARALNIVDMLDSTIKQLAGSDRDSKIDAYMMLSRALKATNNLPDRVALKNQMSLFMQFIQRDLSHRDGEGNLDSSLTNHSLMLLATFHHFPAIAATLTAEFGLWLLDYSIRALEDRSTPKDVLRHLMPVVACQSLPAKAVTAARLGRLVKALHQLENHVTGKGIVQSRLRIYRRLVRQYKGHMALHVDWLEDVFMDMLSGVKDIQAQAISLATEAGFALRSERLVKQKVNEILQTANKDTQYIDFLVQRLQEMLSERPASAAVPQIWSAVILFVPRPLEKWRHYGPWLTVAQRAFNTDDAMTRQEANHAWDRHVYLELRGGKTGAKGLELLCRPLMSQLQRKSDSRNLEAALRLRKTVLGSICNLYYYSFAPDNGNISPELAWNAVVQPVMAQLVGLDGKPDMPLDYVEQAARLLASLLDVTTPRVWRQDRIQEMPPAGPDELPPLDARWIRRNCDRIMHSVGPVLEKRFLELADKDSVISRLWRSLVGSVAVASAKDIKVSDDTVKFFACTFGLLSKILASGGRADDGASSTSFLPSVKSFILVLTGALRLLPFTEKRLILTAPHTYEALSIPHASDRPSRPDAPEHTILHHLFVMLSSIVAPGKGDDDDDAVAELLLTVFEPFFSGKTAVARIDLAFELLNLLPPEAPPPNPAWIMAAQNLRLILETGDDGTLLHSGDQSSKLLLGPRYRDILSLLERGLANHPDLPAKQWFSLFDRLSEHVAQEFGEAGRCIVLVEPLSKAILDLHGSQTKNWGRLALRAFRALVEGARFPRDRASLEIARHRLWGTPMNTTRGSVFDPFEYLYRAGNHVLESFYRDFGCFEPDGDVSPTIDAVMDFIIRCLPLSGVRTLSRLSAGLCPWIRDEASLLGSGGETLLTKSVSSAWQAISTEMAGRKPLAQADFDCLEPILSAALQSKHLGIKGRAVETWNLLVRNEEKPACSDSLKTIVSNLGLTGDQRAGHGDGGFGAQASSQARPQGETSLVLLSSTSSQQTVHSPLSPSASDSTSSSKRSKKKRRSDTTLDASRTKAVKRAAISRLRHEHSNRGGESLDHHHPESPRQTAAADLQSGGGTPRHSAAFKDVSRGTPTPRRGQSLQLDDGEPASSPLNPRPYPLISEIQSRARNAGSDTEDWRFSSPAATPTARHRHGLGAPKPPVVPSSSSAPRPGRTKNGGQAEQPERGHQDSEIIDLTTPSQGPRLPSERGDPQTPRRQHPRPTPRDEATPQSVDEPLQGAKSGLDASNLPPCLPNSSSESVDTSYTLSELDETCVQKLIIELQAHDDAGESARRGGRACEERRGESLDAEMRKDEPAPPPRARQPADGSKRPGAAASASPARTLAPLRSEATTEKAQAAKGKPGRKRKSLGPAGVSEGEKRRRVDGKVVEAPETPAAATETPATREQQRGAWPERSLRRSTRKIPSSGISSVQTRGGTRRRSLREQEEVQGQGQGQAAKKQPDVGRQGQKQQQQHEHEGGTDDEVLSQLMTESNAGSHESSHREEQDAGSAGREGPSEAGGGGGGGGGGGKFETLVRVLQSGLDRLRIASLSRDEVYRMEDMLMDMKRELFAAEKRGREGTRGA